MERLPSHVFTWSRWRAGNIAELGIRCRYAHITSPQGKSILKKYAVGYHKGEALLCRPKTNEVAIMFFKDGRHFWFHLREPEFLKVFEDVQT